MNIKTIIASLVLGSSSIAMAHPSVTFSADAQAPYGTSVVRDQRFDDDCNTPVAQPVVEPIYLRDGQGWHGQPMPQVYRPVMLASGVHFSGDGRTFIPVGVQAGRFNTLQISADRGRTFIRQIYIQFENGQEQIVRNLDRMLIGNQSLSLDLDGNHRAIRRIVVYGSSLNRGWRRAEGAFTVTAA